MKNLLRASALLALRLIPKCGCQPQNSQPYENPADCRIVKGKRVCNSACPVG